MRPAGNKGDSLAARLTSEGPLLDYKLPEYRYYPAKLLPDGTRDWARVRFLQACERLGIPSNRWPRFTEVLTLPAAKSPLSYASRPMPFPVPPFNILQDSATAWRARAEGSFRKHCDAVLLSVKATIEKLVSGGTLTKVEQPKDKASLELRYEWAAKRYCYNEPYKDLATDKHSPEKIRKAVAKVLAEAEIRGGKKRKRAS